MVDAASQSFQQVYIKGPRRQDIRPDSGPQVLLQPVVLVPPHHDELSPWPRTLRDYAARLCIPLRVLVAFGASETKCAAPAACIHERTLHRLVLWLRPDGRLHNSLRGEAQEEGQDQEGTRSLQSLPAREKVLPAAAPACTEAEAGLAVELLEDRTVPQEDPAGRHYDVRALVVRFRHQTDFLHGPVKDWLLGLAGQIDVRDYISLAAAVGVLCGVDLPDIGELFLHVSIHILLAPLPRHTGIFDVLSVYDLNL
mmetsp:Transcript_6182/g.12575  ORF Transcript_6182/g.12575 Transcript_6182/m.12575 type:complete len:254 (-) Transcript_6182:51-812(-)